MCVGIYSISYIVYLICIQRIHRPQNNLLKKHSNPSASTTSALGEKHRRESLFRRVARQPPDAKVRISKSMGFNHPSFIVVLFVLMIHSLCNDCMILILHITYHNQYPLEVCCYLWIL